MIVFPVPENEMVELNALIAEHLEGELPAAERPEGTLDWTYAAACFPEWPWLQQRSKCDLVIPELLLSARDGFEHSLPAIHEYVLYKLIESWIEIEHDAASGETEERHAQEREETAERLQDFLEDAFPDVDFLNPALIARVALERAELQQELDIDVAHYLDLMPADVAEEVRRALARAEARSRDSSTGQT